MPRLEDLTPGAQVKGILAGSPVTVVSVNRKFSKCLAADEAKDAVGGFINLIRAHTVGPWKLLPWIESRDCRSLWFQRDQRAFGITFRDSLRN